MTDAVSTEAMVLVSDRGVVRTLTLNRPATLNSFTAAMHEQLLPALDAARAQAYATPIERIDVSDVARFQDDTIWPWFERLRREDPVHWCADSAFGSYWSVTKFNDIMAVDTNHEVFSSDSGRGGIAIFDAPVQMRRPMFISMDPPRHDEQRKAVSPIVAPGNLANLEPLIRSRVRKILDELPVGEEFDWVQRVSIELTTQMLATLFDFPFEDRRLLTYWSDVATNIPPPSQPDGWERRDAELRKCLEYFTRASASARATRSSCGTSRATATRP